MQSDGDRKPRLLIEACNPDRSVSALRDILAAAGGFMIEACLCALPPIRRSGVRSRR